MNNIEKQIWICTTLFLERSLQLKSVDSIKNRCIVEHGLSGNMDYPATVYPVYTVYPAQNFGPLKPIALSSTRFIRFSIYKSIWEKKYCK